MKPAVEWIAFTLLAAFMQSVRTAGQKSLTKSISPFATTWVRYGFGLPIALIYVAIVWHSFGRPEINWHWTFFTFATLAGIMQIGATWLLVRVLQLRNFAVGTTYAKTEAILTALLAVLFFSATISLIGWISIIIGVAGILIVSVQKSHLSLKQFFTDRSLVYGVGAGLGFALTSLWLERPAFHCRHRSYSARR